METVNAKTKLQQRGRNYLQILTRHGGSKSDKGNGVDTILEVNEATEMSSNVSNDGSTDTDSGDGDDKGGVSVEDSYLNIKENSQRKIYFYKLHHHRNVIKGRQAVITKACCLQS